MPAKSTKGPKALSRLSGEKPTSVPLGGTANAPAAPLSAAFRAALGSAPASDHLHLPGAGIGSRPSKAERKDRSPKPAVARNIAQGPRSGHK